MDAFIIYKAAMEEPLNLNYILLKEMADVRNHNTRSLPFGAFLTRIFLHFNINLNNQPSVDIDNGFSKGTVKKAKNLGLEEVQREGDRMDMDIEGNLAIGSIEGGTDVGYETDPINLKQEQHAGYEMDPIDIEQEQPTGYGTDTLDDNIHRGFTTEATYPTHRANRTQEELSTQEDPLHQGGPPAWFLEYFGKLGQSLGEIKLQQAEIIHNQNRQQEHMGRLESAFYGIREDVDRLRNRFVEQGSKIDKVGNACETVQSMQEDHLQQLSDIRDNLEGIWNTIDPYPPILFDPYKPPY
ncbi:hypothetical protein Acr_18g0009860 [Actinidia rufa]|uniref:Uncharacterized protein n=1 Tax=Actinidia rufa TaxID=165716 RepID=A0A7J0G7N7_9ERIC|nr:hypothetical protein Acr_18g0009860 [Actinidia rufa]